MSEQPHALSSSDPAGNTSDSIAIVGLSCRLPGGVSSPSEFWDLLANGRDAVSDEPPPRFDVDAYFHPDPARGQIYTKAGGFLEAIEEFDAAFFGLSPREAAQMDPQQRIALELAWEALEDAGEVPERLAGSRTGVFVGVSNRDYAELARRGRRSADAYSNSGSASSVVANRISHFFDLRGPSMAIDTACSSSLVAIHQASQSLRTRESDLALAGGVNVLLDPLVSVGFCRAFMLSPSGRCRAFSAAADGYVRAEGGGIIVLKRLRDAAAAGDPIRAVIVGSGINGDGRTPGLAAPNATAQEALLRRVYSQAALASRDVVYVEAHGTGTQAGDPAECAALSAVLGADRDEACWIGSVKTNLGHLEPASGVTGLIKTVLCLEKRCIPASLHCEVPNPALGFGRNGLAVATQPIDLSGVRQPLIVGVNSFGFGGANAHVVLREWHDETPRVGASPPLVGPSLLLLSARGDRALRELSLAYAQRLDQDDRLALDAVCQSAALRRGHHRDRLALRAASREEAIDLLRRFATGRAVPGSIEGRAARQPIRTAFVFSGNGAQWAGMARGLLETNAVFRSRIGEIDALLAPRLGWSIERELGCAPQHTRMQRTEVAQPLLFAIQLGLVGALERYAISPDLVIGHSVGEVAAAHICGALTLEQACRVIAERSAAQAKTAGMGRMAAVGLSETDAASAISESGAKLEIAAINSASSVTLAGLEGEICRLQAYLQGTRCFFRPLDLDYAFHSSAMDRLEPQIRDRLADVVPGEASIPFVSAVTGSELPGSYLSGQYWWDNIRQPVRFAEAIESALGMGANVLVEVGPHPILAPYIEQRLRSTGVQGTYIATLSRDSDEEEALLDCVSRCFCAGVGVDVGPLSGAHRSFVRLPAYPWQRERHWPSGDAEQRTGRRHPLLGDRVDAGDPIWANEIDPSWPTYLQDHVVRGATVFPAAGFIELAAAAATQLGWRDLDVVDLEILRPLVFVDRCAQCIEVVLSTRDRRVRVQSRPAAGGAPVVHATAGYRAGRAVRIPTGSDVDGVLETAPTYVSAETHYEHCEALGLQYGPRLRAVVEIRRFTDEALARIEAPLEVAAEQAQYRLHPAVLDACLQVGIEVLPEETGGTYIPVRVDRVHFQESTRAVATCRVRARSASRATVSMDCSLFDADGGPIAVLLGVVFRRMASSGDAARLYRWRPRLLASRSEAPGLGNEVQLDLVSAISTRTRRLQAELRSSYYEQAREELNELATEYAAAAIRELTAELPSFSTDWLLETGRLVPEAVRLFEYLLQILAAEGAVGRRAGRWTLRSGQPEVDPDVHCAKLIAKRPAFLAEFDVVGRAGRLLSKLLTGNENALRVLLGNRAFDVAEHLFESGTLFRACNAAAADAVRAWVARWPKRSPLRVLEVGGGTGGLSSVLLPELPADRTEYVFTDVTPVMLERARSKLGSLPHVRYALLDIEASDPDPDALQGRFDLIVAANVLHATKDLRRVVRSLRARLSSGGHLLLLEGHGERFIHVSMGTLPGWWLFEDSALRKNSSLLSATQWRALLTEEGFSRVQTLGDDPEQTDPSHSLILARRGCAPDEAEGMGGVASAEEARPQERLKSWLVFVEEDQDDPLALCARLCRRLQERGDAVVRIRAGEKIDRSARDEFVIDPHNPTDYETLFDWLGQDPLPCTDIVHLWGASPLGAGVTDAAVREKLASRALSVVYLSQALLRAAAHATGEADPRLWGVTCGALPDPAFGSCADPLQASLVGLFRSLRNEHARLEARVVDLDPADPSGSLDALLLELPDPGVEPEIILRQGARYANRLVELDGLAGRSRAPRGTASAMRLTQRARGKIDALEIEPAPIPVPGPDEILIRVRSAGLNFHDVLGSMGMLPEDAPRISETNPVAGLEFAGDALAGALETHGLRPGERVFGLAEQSFRSHACAPRNLLTRIPDWLSYEDAATLPVVCLTAYYALATLARLAPAERILIHSATGGVGMAAVQYALWRGAQLIATAGSEEKRQLLRHLGVQHVFDSRSYAFVDDVRAATDGEGVDVVLNSLHGQAIPLGLSLLRTGGRFLELGKRDLYENARVAIGPLRNNGSFHGIDLIQLIREQPQRIARVWHEVADLIEKGVFRPLPYRSFDAARASNAVRHMQRSRHVGKVLLDFERIPVFESCAAQAKLSLDPEAVYLVTGGLTGLGLATAMRLARRGARHMLLAGRRGACTPGAGAALRQLAALGVEARPISLDVANQRDVQRAFAKLRAEGRRLAGVVHAAMSLADTPIEALGETEWKTVADPKVLGAWNLHWASRDLDLDFFVLYSSGAAVYGNPGQAAYVASNCCLESLAHHRRSLGLPAQAIAWGSIADVGFLSRRSRLKRHLADRIGLLPMPSQEALDLFERVVSAADPVAVVAARADWGRLRSSMPRLADSPLLEEVGAASDDPLAGREEGRERAIGERLRQLPESEAVERATEQLARLSARILRASRDALDTHCCLTDLGMDSLMLVELQVDIEALFGVELPSMELSDARSSLGGLAERLVEQLRREGARSSEDAPGPGATAE